MKKIIKKISIISLFVFGFTSYSNADMYGVGGYGGYGGYGGGIPGVSSGGIPGMSNVPTVGTSGRTKPIYFWSTMEWSIFWDHFEITGWGTCPDWPIPDFGIDVRMIEVAGYAETTPYKWSFPWIGTSMGGGADFMSNGVSRTGKDDDDTNQGGRGDIVWAHYIKFPIMGILFPGGLGIFCFDKPYLPFFYFSEVDPTYIKDYLAVYLHPVQSIQKAVFLNPAGLISTIVDGVASEGVNMAELGGNSKIAEYMGPVGNSLNSLTGGISSYMAGSKKYLNFVRDAMMYSAGANGFSTQGGYGAAKDPSKHHEIVILSMMDTIVTMMNVGIGFTSQFWKQTNSLYFPIPTMCWPVPSPHILKSQYIIQRAGWPSKGTGHVSSVSAAHAANANTLGAQDEWVSYLWKFRDYRAFAYKCL